MSHFVQYIFAMWPSCGYHTSSDLKTRAHIETVGLFYHLSGGAVVSTDGQLANGKRFPLAYFSRRIQARGALFVTLDESACRDRHKMSAFFPRSRQQCFVADKFAETRQTTQTRKRLRETLSSDSLPLSVCLGIKKIIIKASKLHEGSSK